MSPPIISLATTSSTQEEAKAQARQGCAHGLVVVAETQTGGRGRRGRSWLSGPHGLWLSMVLRTHLPMARASRLPLCACDVIAAVLSPLMRDAGADVYVKWPNDLLVPSATTHPLLGPFQKAGGLLVEAVDVAGDHLQTAVLGVGLNLRAPDGGWPPDLQSAGALGLDVDRLELAARLQAALVDVVDKAADDEFAAVRARLSARSATLRRRVTVDGLSGTAVAIADDGALVIERDDGRREAVHAGDVAVVG